MTQSILENSLKSNEKFLNIKENVNMKVLLNKKANFTELKEVEKIHDNNLFKNN